jgi:Protein of unknown function (DUF2867)
MIPRTHSDADAARSGPCRGVREVPPPAESGVASWFRAADLVEAFAVPIDAADVTKGVDSLARSALGDPAPWIRLLLGLRDALVAGFGVKTSQEVRRAAIADKADRIDFFRIRARSDRELILGEDDRHLDFRLSLLLRARPDSSGDELVATAVVRCHNALGRVYLALIARFHRLVVISNLSRASNKGWRIEHRNLG